MQSVFGISSRRILSKLVRSHWQAFSSWNISPGTQVHFPFWLHTHSASSSNDSSFSGSSRGAHLQQRQVFVFPVEMQMGTCFGNKYIIYLHKKIYRLYLNAFVCLVFGIGHNHFLRTFAICIIFRCVNWWPHISISPRFCIANSAAH